MLKRLVPELVVYKLDIIKDDTTVGGGKGVIGGGVPGVIGGKQGVIGSSLNKTGIFNSG